MRRAWPSSLKLSTGPLPSGRTSARAPVPRLDFRPRPLPSARSAPCRRSRSPREPSRSRHPAAGCGAPRRRRGPEREGRRSRAGFPPAAARPLSARRRLPARHWQDGGAQAAARPGVGHHGARGHPGPGGPARADGALQGAAEPVTARACGAARGAGGCGWSRRGRPGSPWPLRPRACLPASAPEVPRAADTCPPPASTGAKPGGRRGTVLLIVCELTAPLGRARYSSRPRPGAQDPRSQGMNSSGADVSPMRAWGVA